MSATTTRQFLDALRGRATFDARPAPDPSWAAELYARGAAKGRCALASGEVPILGQYRVLERLGSGGMGQVYKAEHVVMRRTVALKVIAEHLVHDAATVNHFHREVQLAAQLAHPNIVTAHDAAEADGLHFLVMEYVEGTDLGRLVEALGPLPVPIVVECLRQIAHGLQHAHERGLVHCDIKPSNLLLSARRGLANSLSEGEPFVVKILDFGLARLAGTAPESATLPSLPAPASGLAGTPDFMAPEQARECPTADVRGDLYSLGCTAYFLLAGRVPFPGGAWSEKLLRHQFDDPEPLTSLRPDVPPEIDAVVCRLMAKDPEQRYPMPAALAEILEVWLSDQGLRFGRTALVPAPAARTRLAVDDPTERTPGRNEEQAAPVSDGKPASRLRRLPMPLAAAAAVVVGLSLAWVARRANPERFALPSLAFTATAEAPAITFTLGHAPGQSFARLETAVAAAQDGDTVFVRGSGSLHIRPLAIRDKALSLRAADGARPRLLLDPDAVSRAWQPMITTDRALTVAGVELVHDLGHEPPSAGRAAHLLYCERASLHLIDCRLTAPRGSALVVCRDGREVEMRGCQVVAHASALSIEAGDTPSELHLADNTIEIQEPGGAALSLWGHDGQGQQAMRVRLENNRVRAGRVVALSGVVAGVAFSAQGNHFTFREALLSFAGYASDRWRHSTRWQGQNNQYQAQSDWLAVEGGPGGVHNLASWQSLWQTTEAGSREAATSAVLSRAPAE